MKITVLESENLCCKSHWLRAGEIETSSYDSIFKCKYSIHDVNNIRQVYNLIDSLSRCVRKAIVNAFPIKDEPNVWKRRLINDKDGAAATLLPYDHEWICLDYDQDEVPEDVKADDVPEYIINNFLPEFLRQASYVYQFSNSAGIGKNGLGKVHLWFVMDKVASYDQLKAAFDGYPIDEAAFRANQVLYTANPIIDLELDDPISKRVGFIEKENDTFTLPNIKIKKKAEYKPRTYTQSKCEDELLKLCAQRAVNLIDNSGKTYHYPDLIKLGSSLLRCGLDMHDVMYVCKALKDVKSNSPLESIEKAITQAGKKTGIPWLESQCGVTFTQIKRELLQS
ncbi:hypothetical protein [Photobacterium damselae]|uniref:hypothetical protein n=1 Tax=Photobacterium damselae TaxID=38293 RepID=UPI00370AD593